MDQPSSTDESGITLRIKFKSESVDNFIARYGADVSPGGIFIRTRDPLGVGTTLRFEFSLADGHSLLNGNGTVVWVREPDQSRAGVVPGMGVRFDKLTPESQGVLATILAGKGGKENSTAARLSASRPIMPAASLEVESGAEHARPTPASIAQVGDDGSSGTADPWQSEKTEIASLPANFSVDGPRNSEELSLSGAESSEFGVARGAPPAGAPISTRKPTPALGADVVVKAPPGIGAGARDAATGANLTGRRNSPLGGVAATTGSSTASAPSSPPSGSNPAVQVPGPTSPGRALSPAVGVPASPPPALGHAVSPRPAPAVAPVGEPAEDLNTDPLKQPAMPGAAAVSPPSGRGKMILVIVAAAAATAAVGFVLVRRLAAPPQAPVAAPVPQIARAPVTPEEAPKPAADPAPPSAPTQPSPGNTAAPAPAAAPQVPPAPAPTPPPTETPPAASPAPPTPAATAPPKAPAVAAAKPTKAPKAPKSKRPAHPATESASSGQGTEATSAEESTGVEEYWLRVRSTPAGAEVLIDGQVEGKTPFERRLFDPTRPYALSLRKSGFETHEQMLSASDDWVKKGNKRTLTVAAKLTKTKGPAPADEKPAGEKPAAEPGVGETPTAQP